MARRKLPGKRILLTGASSGIGYSLAKQLADRGANLLITARREDRLAELAQSIESQTDSSQNCRTLHWIAGDITDPEHRRALVTWCQTHWGCLDVLINNAGAGAIGPFASASTERLKQVMDVDFFAAVELTRLALPLLRPGNQPAILNVGSVLAHRAVPNKSEYCAAKFALRGWSESLRCELAAEGIDVLNAHPSTTRSEFFDSLIETDQGTKSRSLGAMTPDQVAACIVKTLCAGKRDVIYSLGGRLLAAAGRYFPRTLDRFLS